MKVELYGGGSRGAESRDGQGRDEKRKRKRGRDDGAKNVQGRREMREELRDDGGERRNAIFPFGAFSSDRGTTCARLSDF